MVVYESKRSYRQIGRSQGCYHSTYERHYRYSKELSTKATYKSVLNLDSQIITGLTRNTKWLPRGDYCMQDTLDDLREVSTKNNGGLYKVVGVEK